MDRRRVRPAVALPTGTRLRAVAGSLFVAGIIAVTLAGAATGRPTPAAAGAPSSGAPGPDRTTVTGDRATAPPMATATPTPTGSAPTRLVIDGESLTVGAGPGQLLTGRTALPAGTTLTLLVEATGGEPFLVPTTVTVDRHGRFRAVIDFSAVAPGTSIRVQVSFRGTVLTSTRGTVVACSQACTTARSVHPREGTHLATVGNRRPLAQSPGSVVRGTTSLPAGTQLTITLQFTGDRPTKNRTVVVAADGSFKAVFDLATIPEATGVTVMVRYRGQVVASASGTVLDCEGRCDWASGSGTRTSTLGFVNQGPVETASRGGALMGIAALVLAVLLAAVGIGVLLGRA